MLPSYPVVEALFGELRQSQLGISLAIVIPVPRLERCGNFETLVTWLPPIHYGVLESKLARS
jgi:hypothetical protein